MQPAFQVELKALLSSLPTKSGVDLILDFGVITSTIPSLPIILDRVGSLNLWRTFSILTGSFPKDLSGFRPGQHRLERIDWTWWKNQYLSAPKLVRVPSFGDYTTQHGKFSDPPPRANFSASIRYTSENHWIIMRGEGVFTDGGPGFAQWPANAQLLCEREEFCGENFSAGDKYIYDMAQQSAKTGNAETWLRASINHHIVFAARQVANLTETRV